MFFLTELPVDCGPPHSIANASVNYTSTAEGSVAVYECDERFFQSGQFISTCLRNGDSGRWSPDPKTLLCSMILIIMYWLMKVHETQQLLKLTENIELMINDIEDTACL